MRREKTTGPPLLRLRGLDATRLLRRRGVATRHLRRRGAGLTAACPSSPPFPHAAKMAGCSILVQSLEDAASAPVSTSRLTRVCPSDRSRSPPEPATRQKSRSRSRSKSRTPPPPRKARALISLPPEIIVGLAYFIHKRHINRRPSPRRRQAPSAAAPASVPLGEMSASDFLARFAELERGNRELTAENQGLKDRVVRHRCRCSRPAQTAWGGSNVRARAPAACLPPGAAQAELEAALKKKAGEWKEHDQRKWSDLQAQLKDTREDVEIARTCFSSPAPFPLSVRRLEPASLPAAD